METENTHMAILKELSDIKASLSVNTNETSNIKSTVGEIKTDIKEVKNKVEFQNGRVRTLEDWAKDAQKIIESNSKTLSNLKSTKVQIWTAIVVLTAVGGFIIKLALMAVDSKVDRKVAETFLDYKVE